MSKQSVLTALADSAESKRNLISRTEAILSEQKDLQEKLGKITSPYRPVSAYKIRRLIAGQ